MLEEILCNEEFDLTAQNHNGETALHVAARNGIDNIVWRLLDYNFQNQIKYRGSGRETPCDLLDIYDNFGQNALHAAIGAHYYQTVKIILNFGSMMSAAFESSNYDRQQNEISLDVDANTTGSGYNLIDSKTQDPMSETGLIMAAREKRIVNILELLLEQGTNVNLTDSKGQTALHWCARTNNVRGAQLLIQFGANLNVHDNDDRTPINCALSEPAGGNLDVCDVLIAKKAYYSEEDWQAYNKMIPYFAPLRSPLPRPSSSHQFSSQSIPVAREAEKQSRIKSSDNLLVGGSSGKRKHSETTMNSTVSSIVSKKPFKSKKPKTQSPSPPSSVSYSANMDTMYNQYAQQPSSYYPESYPVFNSYNYVQPQQSVQCEQSVDFYHSSYAVDKLNYNESSQESMWNQQQTQNLYYNPQLTSQQQSSNVYSYMNSQVLGPYY